jgi:hypothetical protein
VAYSKAKLKSNGGKTSPCFKPGARLDVSDKRKIPFPSVIGIRTPHRSTHSPSGEKTQMEDFFLIKPTDALISQIYFIKKLYMFRQFDDIYQCRMYSGKLLVMGRGTARNM